MRHASVHIHITQYNHLMESWCKDCAAICKNSGLDVEATLDFRFWNHQVW